MAAVSQTVTGVAQSELFSGVVTDYQPNNPQPRGRVFFTESASITAKGAGDTKVTILSTTLPVGFAYAYESFFATLNDTTLDMVNYENLGLQGLQFSTPNLSNDVLLPVVSLGDNSFSSATNSAKSYNLVKLFSNVIYSGTPNVGIVIKTSFFDNEGVNATAAHKLDFYVSFLQYDVEQAHHVQVNAPTPVIVRG